MGQSGGFNYFGFDPAQFKGFFSLLNNQLFSQSFPNLGHFQGMGQTIVEGFSFRRGNYLGYPSQTTEG